MRTVILNNVEIRVDTRKEIEEAGLEVDDFINLDPAGMLYISSITRGEALKAVSFDTSRGVKHHPARSEYLFLFLFNLAALEPYTLYSFVHARRTRSGICIKGYAYSH